MNRSTVFLFLLLMLGSAANASVDKPTLDGRFGTSCASSRVGGTNLCRVSFYRLIAEPERYNGKMIQVTGYLATVFGRKVLFPSRESYQADIQLEGIELMDMQVLNPCKGRATGGLLPSITVVGLFDGRYEGADLPRLGSIHDILSVSCSVRIPE